MGLFGKSEKEKRYEEWEKIKAEIYAKSLKEEALSGDVEAELDAIKNSIRAVIRNEIDRGMGQKISEAKEEQCKTDTLILQDSLKKQKESVKKEIDAEIKEALKGSENTQALYHLGRLQRRLEAV